MAVLFKFGSELNSPQSFELLVLWCTIEVLLLLLFFDDYAISYARQL